MVGGTESGRIGDVLTSPISLWPTARRPVARARPGAGRERHRAHHAADPRRAPARRRPPVVRVATAFATVLALAVLASCAALPGDRLPLHVANGTTLDVTLVVNGLAVTSFGPGEETPAGGFAGPLPPLPWTVAVTTPSGRVLATMTVSPGVVASTVGADGRTEYAGRMARADLSCGRLDVWAGDQRPSGPAPGPGVPGDCG